MNTKQALGVLALALTVGLTACSGGTSATSTTSANASASASAACEKATVTMLGTIKPEIQDQFLAAVEAYNASQSCYKVESVPGDRKLTFLQNVTPMYAANNAPTIMYTLQEIPDMADKVMDWSGTELVKKVPADLLISGNVGGKQVGVPSTVEAFGLLYNKAVLDKAGVDPAGIKTRDDLEAAFKKVQASGTGAVRFSAIWWSLGAHFSNMYFANSAADHEGRLKVLDDMAAGKKDLMADPVFKDYLATFELLKKYNQAPPNLTDTEYDLAVKDLATGKAAFWFMGNWAEPNLLENNAQGEFGVMPLPISNDAAAKSNTSIPVGVPGYFMVDEKQSTAAERAGAVDFLTWLFTSPEGQKFVAGPVADGGMNFIPAYKDFTVQPQTFMAKAIAKFVSDGNTLEWINTYYPAGGQDLYGASGQKLITGKIDGAAYAAELQKAWLNAVKTWRGEKKS